MNGNNFNHRQCKRNILIKVKIDNLSRTLAFLTLVALTTTTLFVTPWSVTHPYSIPKLIPLISFTFAIIPVVYAILKTNAFLLKKYFLALLMLLINFVILTIVLVYPQGDFYQELYGIWGRSNGFLTYLSFIVIMISGLLYPVSNYLSLFIKVLLSVGILSLFYGFLQFLKLVQIAKIDGNNTQPVGFFGNENFYSSFIGIFCVVSITMALIPSQNLFIRFSLIALAVCGNLGIFLANSQQGFLVFFIGLLVTFFVKLNTSKFRSFSIPFALSSSGCLILITLGFLQKGPFKNFLYEETLTFRGYYWRAGLKMILDNPIFGVGFDGYRDWYRRSRAQGATSRLAGNDIADSAHSYFIDIAASGGLPLAISYLCIVMYVIFCSIKIIRQMKEFNGPVVAVVSAWYAFTTQTVFSIVQPGLTIWGWILSGLVIAIYKNPKLLNSVQPQKNNLYSTNLKMLIFFTIGFLISVQPFIASSMYRKAVETQDYNLLIEAAKKFPQEANMLAAAGGALIGLGKYNDARELLNISISKYPNFYESWYIYSLLPGLTELEKDKIELRLKFLEPLLIDGRSNNE
jgi:O-antigen ligase